MLSIDLAEAVGKPHLSYSSIKYALQDMRLWEMYMKGQLKKTSDALTFGSLYDCMLFTPEEFKNQFLVIDDTGICEKIGGKAPRMTNKYRDWMIPFKEKAEALNLEIISQEDVTKSQEMIDRLKVTGVLENYLVGDYQKEFNTEIDGVPVRGFLDCLGSDYITDLKSARTVSGFKYTVRDYGYDIQAYIYMRVFGMDKFYWVAQEKSYPFLIAVYEASDETLSMGEHKFNTAVERIKQYLHNKKKTDTFFVKGVI